MTYKTWEDIYRQKETQELYSIYKGRNYPTFEQKQLALKILKERSFDFSNGVNHVKEWKSIDKKKEVAAKADHPLLFYLIKNMGYFISIIAGILFLVVLSEVLKMQKQELRGDAGLGVYALTVGLLCTTIVGLIIQMLISTKKTK